MLSLDSRNPNPLCLNLCRTSIISSNVKILSEGDTAYILGDLVPSEDHLNHYAMKQMDVEPLQSKKAKTLLLRQAYEENAVLLFYHSIHTNAGRLLKDVDRKYVLEDVK